MNNEQINTALESILEAAKQLGIENLTKIKFLPSRHGYTVEIASNNQQWYLGLTELGYVEIIRADSPDGKVVYYGIDD